MANPRRVSLEETLLTIFTTNKGWAYTDLLIVEGKPIMGRVASMRWEPVVDDFGAPIKISRSVMADMLREHYTSDADPVTHQGPAKKWEDRLAESFSLHPSVFLEAEIDGERKVFRIRLTIQRQGLGHQVGMMVRALRKVPESVEELGFPIQATTLSRANSGLVLVCGSTGAGKTTTVAAMVNEINTTRTANILTIEDPVEYIHEDKMSIVNQRELGIDINTFERGVKDALRFVPDVIMIGEIRDEQTMRAALRAAESGHLVLSTMHAPSTITAVRKVLGYLQTPAEVLSFASTFVGAIWQALLVDSEGKKHLAYEILCDRRQPGSAHSIQAAIAETLQDQSGAKLLQLENSLRAGNLGPSCIPMIDSLRKLLASDAKLDPARVAAVAYHLDDITEIMKPR